MEKEGARKQNDHCLEGKIDEWSRKNSDMFVHRSCGLSVEQRTISGECLYETDDDNNNTNDDKYDTNDEYTLYLLLFKWFRYKNLVTLVVFVV